MIQPYIKTGARLQLVVYQICDCDNVPQDPEVVQSENWIVPHDSDHKAMNALALDIGETIVDLVARQKPMPVVRIEIMESTSA